MRGLVARLFPTLVYTIKYEKDMKKEMESIKNFEYAPNGPNNEKTKDHYILNRPELKNINDFIKENLKYFLDEVLLVEDNLIVTQSWINRNEKGMSHPSHKHPNSMVSGVFYFNNTDSSPITFTKFDDWGISFNHKDKDSPDLRTAALVADSGVLALFPSSLSHYVPINTSDEARISLSFNTFAKDFLGNKDSLTYVDFRKD